MPAGDALTRSRRAIAARTARSASSSCATGTPNTAMTASPMNFSTVAPCSTRISRTRANVRPSAARSTSASYDRVVPLESTMSAKRTVTTFRSCGMGRVYERRESDLTTGRHCRTARLTRGAGGEQRDTSLVRGAQARRDRWGDTQEGGEEAQRRTRDRGGQRPARESGPKGLEEAQWDEEWKSRTEPGHVQQLRKAARHIDAHI